MSRLWFADFDFVPGALIVRKTGIRVPLEWGVIQEFLNWCGYYVSLGGARLERPAPFTVAFYPDRARPWYLIWPVVRAAGGRIIDDPGRADLVIHFDDSIRSPTPPPKLKRGALLINGRAHDVSKSAVAAAFEAAFGYELALDPTRHIGEAVEKSEGNGVHDGRIVRCPTPRRQGLVYQKLVENVAADGMMEDLRTPTLGGRPICVFVKRRVRKERFSNHNSACVLKRAEDVFSAEEIARIGDFCANLGLDWGGIDVLRDARDGKLYIVDANKTDMGPPIALPLADKLTATRDLARALRAFMYPPADGGLRRVEQSRP
jgi:hypothetical protein